MDCMEKEMHQMLETGAILSLYLEKNVLLSSSTSVNLGTCLRNEKEVFERAATTKHIERLGMIDFNTDTDSEETDRMVEDLNKLLYADLHYKKKLEKLIEEYNNSYKKVGDSGKVFTKSEVYKMIDDLYKMENDGAKLKAAVLEVDRCETLAMREHNDKSKIQFVISNVSNVWRVFQSKILNPFR